MIYLLYVLIILKYSCLIKPILMTANSICKIRVEICKISTLTEI